MVDLRTFFFLCKKLFAEYAANNAAAPWLFCMVMAGIRVTGLTTSAQAQDATDSARWLDEVRITDTRLNQFAAGDKVEAVREHAIGLLDHTNLATLLARYAAVNVRSYGVSGLSTASVRGTGSNHTAVLWEGVNLQSPMHGSLDLTLVPVSFVDEVSLQFGGAGSLFGSGTLGGVIHLSSAGLPAQRGWQGRLYQQLGSFGSRYTGVNAGFSSQKAAFRIRGFTQQADNDFPFFNIYRNREERREHAGIRQQGMLAEIYFAPSREYQLNLKYWVQDNGVQVPGVAAAGTTARAIQTDVFHRAILQGAWQGKQHVLKAHTALLYHDLVYDDKIGLPSESQSVSWITEAENTYYLNNDNWLYAGVNHAYETAQTQSYGSRQPQRHQTALFVSYRTQLQQLEATLGMRETLVAGAWSPFLPSLGLGYTLSEHWQLVSKVARSYRVPTFNDLYWAGAGGRGNPDLQPETGWSSEVGVQAAFERQEGTAASGAITVFSNSIHQWIGWIPLTASVWSPVNVEQVWARGVEASTQWQHTLGTHSAARLWAQYSYTKSTKEAIEEGGSATELHKQLIYTPYHQGKATVQVVRRRLTLGYAHNFTGAQFATSSNQQVLPHYQTGDLSFTYEWLPHAGHQLQLNAALNNVFNQQYEVRRGYPMPGRNYQISIVYQFNP